MAKDTSGTFKLIDRKQTDNAMAKNEKDKQTNKSTQLQHRRLQTKQKEFPLKYCGNLKCSRIVSDLYEL